MIASNQESQKSQLRMTTLSHALYAVKHYGKYNRGRVYRHMPTSLSTSFYAVEFLVHVGLAEKKRKKRSLITTLTPEGEVAYEYAAKLHLMIFGSFNTTTNDEGDDTWQHAQQKDVTRPSGTCSLAATSTTLSTSRAKQVQQMVKM
jgi:predicted transcriptional regulator